MSEAVGLNKTYRAPGKVRGTSPSEDTYYVLVLFDISEAKKYRFLVRALKKYGLRVQKSVFEAQITQSKLKRLLVQIERLMSSERFFNPDDNVRVYKIAGECELSVFGECVDTTFEENIFF
ncbi:CRISPR-associated endonuclease Cas2 [uncultured Olsenella sp.]|uniref:CRISPR-associated endonuclease Cas2 n=1 Tax=uncultured Olsenella sp. TaxID=190764 RepID=UPI0026DBE2D0|nr:CRISPR-associated endonuclease Cas2 [uncultured Olsenella sp.]